ncbi:hypothetical protein O0I10_002243 [Lichtheimia ornata]|uniref:Mediator of RNA polymerase II transcription subunit 21 n=1 Tax=Lichtheimia ornata TaxID=688661 RepID=A0AAD7Y2Q9_9FUNG|nr:uncharacterized protein O0I10_002243 [Lichtheimia ornata]KAJ8661912.1 hypothetical protein O0I10_002243 [Lichtheimia ornata]
MDRLTQLQDGIDAMARMLTNSLFYVHEKSSMAQLNDSIPIAQPKVQADPPEVFQQNLHELAGDLVKKAKEIDALIEVLPGIKNTEEEQMELLKELEEKNKQANEEYEAAVREMESVQAKVTETLRTIADDWSQSGDQQVKKE